MYVQCIQQYSSLTKHTVRYGNTDISFLVVLPVEYHKKSADGTFSRSKNFHGKS